MQRTITGYTATQTTVAVAAASTQVVGANPNRKYLGIFNVGGSAVTLNMAGGTATNVTGVVLGPANTDGTGGGHYETPAGLVPVNKITGISASGTVNVIVVEGE